MAADELNRLGAALHEKGDLDGARLHYLAALKTDPSFLPALSNIHLVLNQQGYLDAAAVYVRRLLTIVPHSGQEWNNLGNLLMRLERYDESRTALTRAVEYSPRDPLTWYNLALLSHWTGRYRDATEYMDKAEKLGGSSPQLRNDRAHMELGLGENLSHALKLYEARWKTMTRLPPWEYDVPEWHGESLYGKSILFHAEQGYGDTIMTARFAHDLVAHGAHVGLCVPIDLVRLFETQDWPNIDVLDIHALTNDIMGRFDYHSPMMSAMRWLGIERNAIRPAPYIFVQEAETVLPRGFNVGICWASGKRNNEMDWRRRVSPLKCWLSLAEIPGVNLHSLQKGDESVEIVDLGAEALINDPTPEFETFYETAEFISKLDLVITVDTAIVHLAGAMGVSCWMLSQFSHCWRWWEIGVESGWPWYETVSIIRQDQPGAWERQLKKVTERLRMKLFSDSKMSAAA